MNPFNQILETGTEHLRQLRFEAYVAALQPKAPSLRRRLARMLKQLARLLDEPQVAHV